MSGHSYDVNLKSRVVTRLDKSHSNSDNGLEFPWKVKKDENWNDHLWRDKFIDEHEEKRGEWERDMEDSEENEKVKNCKDSDERKKERFVPLR